MSDWQEAPSSLEKRKRAYAAAVARGADPACAPSPLLGRAALDRIIGAARLNVVGEDAEAACRHVLNTIANRLAHQTHNGARLSRRYCLEPLLKAWKRWRRWQGKGGEGVAAARANLSKLVEESRDFARYPIPSPFAHPEAFQRWLADESVAHGIESDLLLECLSAQALERAKTKARRVSEAKAVALGESFLAADHSRDLSDGGTLNDHEADRRLEMLLAVFWNLFGEHPNDSVASKRPRERSNGRVVAVLRETGREASAADGGAAARFVEAFEAECQAAINDRQLGDALRPNQPRVQRWKAAKLSATAQRITALNDQRGECWERWALVGTGADAMLVRTPSAMEAEEA